MTSYNTLANSVNTQNSFNEDFKRAAHLYAKNLRRENWQSYNVEVAKCTSHSFAILLSVIMSKYEYFSSHNELIDHPKHGTGWFYLEVDDVYEWTGLTRYEQEGAVKLGIKLGIIQCVGFGMPCRRHFKVDEIALYNHIIKNISARSGKNPELVGKTENKAESCDPVRGKTPNQFAEKPRTAQYTNPPLESKESVTAEPSGIIFRTDAKGKEVRIDESEILYQLLREKINFKTQHFKEAWKILTDYPNPICDPYLFVKQTLENIQIKEQSQNIKKAQSCNSLKNSKKEEIKKPLSGSDTTSASATKKPVFRNVLEMMETYKKQSNGSPIPSTS